MVESTVVDSIPADSIVFFQTIEESAGKNFFTFKNFGTIHTTAHFDVKVILRVGNSWGRDYHFFLRTFDKAHQLIDSYPLAIWSDSNDQYCYGRITQELIIWQSCDDDSKHQAIINERGEFSIPSRNAN